jgi:hypothetical protein
MDPGFLSNLWLGFGPIILLTTLALVPFIFHLYINRTNRFFSISLGLISILIIVLLFPASIQGGKSIIDTYHSEYVINELLAVPAGNLPYVDFIPQYGILFTWLIAPFKGFFDPDALVTLGLYLMSAATIFAVFLGVWLVYKAMNKKSLPLAILLVVPFTSIAKFPDRENYPGSIYALLSAVPGRIFYGLIIASVTLTLQLPSKSKLRLSTLGFLVGLGIWINQDFVIAAGVVATLFVLFFVRGIKNLMIFVGSGTLGISIYPIILVLLGKSFRFDAVGFFALQYSGGFMAEPIQTPGPVLVILPLIVALFFASALPLYKERFKRQEIPVELKRAVLTANFFSAWSLIGFAYYLNRSYASGQMQILFLPLSIAMASYFYYVLPKLPTELPWSPKSFFALQTWRGNRGKWNIAYLPIALLMALPIATTIAFPSPSVELERLTKAPAENKWPNRALSEAEYRLANITQGADPISLAHLGYLGNSGNYFELKYGVESLNILNSPWDLPPAQTPLIVGCEFMKSLDKQFILLDETGLAFASLFQDGRVCGIYSLKKPHIADGYLWERS